MHTVYVQDTPYDGMLYGTPTFNAYPYLMHNGQWVLTDPETRYFDWRQPQICAHSAAADYFVAPIGPTAVSLRLDTEEFEASGVELFGTVLPLPVVFCER